MMTKDLERPPRRAAAEPPPDGRPGWSGAGLTRRIRVRRELPSGRAVVGALLVTTAAVATYLVARGAEDVPSTSYVVAARDLPPGEVLQPGDLGLVALDLPPEVAASAFTDAGAVLAGVTRGPISAGGLLTGAAVARSGAPAGVAPAHDARGGTVAPSPGDRYREVSFAVPSARSLLGAIAPGDRVDVVATLEERTEVLVQHALVLGADRGGEDALVVSEDVVITLALADGADALAVAHGAAVGELTVLRSTRALDDLPASAGRAAATGAGSAATGTAGTGASA